MITNIHKCFFVSDNCRQYLSSNSALYMSCLKLEPYTNIFLKSICSRLQIICNQGKFLANLREKKNEIAVFYTVTSLKDWVLYFSGKMQNFCKPL